MLQRDIADRLYSIALRRYRKEHPEFVFTSDFAERLWYSIYGKLQREGEDAARAYVETAELLV